MSTTVKMLREHLCREQRQPMTCVESALHGYLIALCDVLRPLGPDGKHGDLHTALCGCDDVEPSAPATTTFASGGVITEDQVRQIDAPVLDAINRPAAASGLGDALRALMDDADPFWVAEKLADLAALADALEAERDRLADERDTLRVALAQERRSMAARLTVLERIKGERDVAREHYRVAVEMVNRMKALVCALSGDESQPCDSGAGAEGSRTGETGARSVVGGVPVPWHGSSLLGRSEGENDEDNRRGATWSDGYRTAAREQLGQDGGRR